MLRLVLCPLFYALIGLHQVLGHFQEQAGLGGRPGDREEVALLATLDMESEMHEG